MVRTRKEAPELPKKLRQQKIPGSEPERFPDLDKAAEKYTGFRDARMQNGVWEQEAAAGLLELMHSHKVTTYEFDGKMIEISQLERVRVKKIKGESNGDSDE